MMAPPPKVCPPSPLGPVLELELELPLELPLELLEPLVELVPVPVLEAEPPGVEDELCPNDDPNDDCPKEEPKED